MRQACHGREIAEIFINKKKGPDEENQEKNLAYESIC